MWTWISDTVCVELDDGTIRIGISKDYPENPLMDEGMYTFLSLEDAKKLINWLQKIVEP